LSLAAWTYVHRRASDRTQGALLLAAGSVMYAPEIAVAASAGMARVRVSSRPAIMVISTGNELVEPGDPIAAHQIRRSNAYAVAAALRQRGFQRVADDHLTDDAQQLRERLRLHLDTHEVLILSGGVSMGQFDFVPRVLEEIGVHCVLHGVAQRPGKPMWFGTSSEGRAVFALPGNPVSTLVCLVRYVIPALYAAMGAASTQRERIALAAGLRWEAPLTGFMPVRITQDDWSRPWATPCPTNTSADFTALALTDGFVELPPGPADVPKGYVTRLYRW
jgi:molybdopterin molybdotransferase